MTIAEQVTRLKTDLEEVKLAGDIEGFNRGYNEGYDAGYAEGQSASGDTEAVYQQGVADGKQAEHDAFWDEYLNHSGYKSLSYLFAGRGWSDETFCPTRGTIITSANCNSKSGNQMFQNSRITDLKGICEARNITLDFSATTEFSQVFCDCGITAVPTIDTRSAISINNLFWNPKKLVTVEKLILKSDGTQTCTKTFNGVSALQNIVIEGKFGNSVDVGVATQLSKASITSIVNALSTTVNGMTLTLSKTAVENAFGSTTADEWTALIAPKIAPNGGWTIILV